MRQDVRLKRLALRASGTVMPLAIGYLLVLAILGIFVVEINLVLGGTSELHNAVDAGGLSFVTASLQHPSIDSAQTPSSNQFWDLGPSLNLQSINRVAGFAMLVELNVAAMKQEGTLTGAATTNAQTVVTQAGSHSQNLKQAIQDQQTTLEQKYFNPICGANSVRMLASGGSIVTANNIGWSSGYVNAAQPGNASNVAIDDQQIPPNVQLDQRVPLQILGVTHKFVEGYVPIDTGAGIRSASQSLFVPLRPPLMPHLISDSEYNNGIAPPTSPYIDPKYCVPNAVCTTGVASVALTGQKMTFSACGVAEAGNAGYVACIPNGFVEIVNNSGNAVIPGKYVYVGSPVPGMADFTNRILQRVYQINPQFVAGSLGNTLSQPITPGHQRQIWNCPPALPGQVTPAPSWLFNAVNQTSPDGKPLPNRVQVAPGLYVHWTPCSGFNGLLGVLQFANT